MRWFYFCARDLERTNRNRNWNRRSEKWERGSCARENSRIRECQQYGNNRQTECKWVCLCQFNSKYLSIAVHVHIQCTFRTLTYSPIIILNKIIVITNRLTGKSRTCCCKIISINLYTYMMCVIDWNRSITNNGTKKLAHMKREKCESGNVNCEIFQFFGFCCYLLDSLKVVVVAFELILGLIFFWWCKQELKSSFFRCIVVAVWIMSACVWQKSNWLPWTEAPFLICASFRLLFFASHKADSIASD